MQFAWDVVRDKLMDSLSAIKNGVNFSERVGEFEQNSANQPSSLCAVAEGPRNRLLWASYQWLYKEVNALCVVALNLFQCLFHVVRREFLSVHINRIDP
ncbi:hypothetical protein ACS0TY_017800 [Phlomoides rotata]